MDMVCRYTTVESIHRKHILMRKYRIWKLINASFEFFKTNLSRIFNKHFSTVVGDYINIMKPTFDFNFGLYQAIKQHKYTKT